MARKSACKGGGVLYFDPLSVFPPFPPPNYICLRCSPSSVCNWLREVCRDELCQPLVDEIEGEWGDAFNMTSLAGMLSREHL